MMYDEVITDGLPDGFSIHMDKMEDRSRQFKMFKDGVFVASGYEFDADHIKPDWAASYYAAPKSKPMIDGILDKFRAYMDAELEQKNADFFFNECEIEERKAELFTLRALGME